MSGSPAYEIGIVDYPCAQAACILGLTDWFGVSSTIVLDHQRSGQTALRVTHCNPPAVMMLRRFVSTTICGKRFARASAQI
jgi:hypothetical protein